MRRPRAGSGFVLIEVLAAAAVAGVALGMLVAVLLAAARVQKAEREASTAWAAASGAFERLRGAPLAELPGREPSALPLPAEAAGLEAAELEGSCRPWKDEPGVRHLRVALRWKAPSGKIRHVVCEGLISDARQR